MFVTLLAISLTVQTSYERQQRTAVTRTRVNTVNNFIIDLENVEWMNSSGLGILISTVTVLRNNNGSLRLINVSDKIKNLLKITKLNTVFTLHDNYEQAVDSF